LSELKRGNLKILMPRLFTGRVFRSVQNSTLNSYVSLRHYTTAT